MGAGSVVPPDLEDRDLDPGLMALLHGLDPDLVANEDVPRVLAAIGRVRARWDALELAWVDETARRDPSAPPGAGRRLARPHRFGADEVRVALGWPRQRAEREVAFADELRELLPEVAAAWYDGVIDRAKARTCHTYLADLPATERARVWSEVAGKIAGWNTGRLAARLRKLTLAAAPDRAEERYERAVAARRAVWFLNPDGTASLALDGVAPGDAAAAKKRISALARALRRTGCPGSMDQLRADITLALLDGTLEGLTSAQILAHFRPTTGNESVPLPSTPATVASDAPPAAKSLATSVAEPGAAKARAAKPAATEPVGIEPSYIEPSYIEPSGTEPDGTVAGKSRAARPDGAGNRPGADVVLELGTLIGADQRPGELPELRGAIPGHVARTEALAQRRGQWIVAVCDHQGYLLCCETLRARPAGATDRYRGGTVELRMTLTQLERWLHDPPPGFEKLIAEIAARYRAWRQRAADLNAQLDRRFPTAGLRRWIETRDQTCLGPGGCGRPARQSDIDHTRDVQHGGKTLHINLSPQCGHDHLLKTEGGWTLHQPEPGVLVWRSPLGQTYRTRADPLIDPPPELGPDPPF
ncbi:hypothetical protein GCM10023321_55840 [Pseudonocardia eucalypti]|uniref:DUF222 domain-containing protein n=1 Tax=Pseudonocardia eucalypti TaxID=648755 RepID=A0ABP9QQC0_9PSEU|nr:hypothetical protein [Pseudonocardia eucalypti]